MKKSLILVFLSFSLVCNISSSTTIERLTFEELVDISVLIVEARVESVSMTKTGKLAHTQVLLEIVDTLKGDDPGEFVELAFLGGEQGGISVSVSGQDIPVKGEHAFYFIENRASNAVNPFTGWSQGQFRILTDANGREYLETDVKQELIEVSRPGSEANNAALTHKLKNMGFSTSQLDNSMYTPVTPEELRHAVATVLITP